MRKNEKGTIVIISSIVVGILMILSVYFLSSTVTETKISNSIESAQTAYYLAEAGINEGIWKLNNDLTWNENFISESLNPDINGNYWEDSFSREIGAGFYSVTIKNSSRGKGELTAISEVPFLGKNARREIKVTIFRGLESPTEDASVFSGGHGANIIINHSNLVVTDGNLFSNHNLILSGDTDLAVYDNPNSEKLEGKVLSTQNINVSGNSQISEYTEICSRNICTEECQNCPPESIPVPMVDFDSESEYSFFSRAQSSQNNNQCSIFCDTAEDFYQCSDSCVFNSNQFEDLLWEVGEGGTLIVENEVTYVTGNLELKGGKNLIIDGILVSDGNIEIGDKYSWNNKGDKREGFSNIEIVVSDEENPSGLLSKRNIRFGNYSLTNDSEIKGVIYAGDSIEMVGVPHKLKIIGAVISRRVFFSTIWEEMEVVLDNDRIIKGLGYQVKGEIIQPYFSPIIRVDHWEEVY